MKNIAYGLIGMLAGFAFAGLLLLVARAPAGEPILLQPAPTQAPIAVHVVGAVAHPGLYELVEGARVQDGINAAGGLLAGAGADALNLAEKLTDGQKLEIPFSGEAPAQDGEQQDLPTSATQEPGAGSGDLLNLNTATQEELEALPGIGPSLAAAIIEYRDSYGGFFVIEDIMNVDGIGQDTFDQIKDLITVY